MWLWKIFLKIFWYKIISLFINNGPAISFSQKLRHVTDKRDISYRQIGSRDKLSCWKSIFYTTHIEWIGWFHSVIPATAGLVGKMFGPQFMATLFGFALFSHQIGGFLGAYLGGYFFSVTGDYTTVWLLDAALAVFAALIHLPIKEKLVYSEVT